jgi:DNA-binding transcriptional ArsR family regulator
MQTSAVPLPSILKLVAHEIRWAILRQLARSDYRVQELVERLGLPQNLVSYHLRKLREGHVVSERRSNADEREVYYRLDLDQLQERYLEAGSLIHPMVTMVMEHPPEQASSLHHPRARVLFLCTENFRLFEGQHFDAIVTVCDRVRESCPTFPGDPECVHWSLLDPASVQGAETERFHAFEQTAQQLTTRIRLLLPLVERKKSRLYEE